MAVALLIFVCVSFKKLECWDVHYSNILYDSKPIKNII
jgi:hypothetical protein